MKKLLVLAMAIVAFASCSKNENINPSISKKERSEVTISFSADETSTKAFFSTSSSAETWEKSLSTVTIFVFNQAGNVLVQREFLPSEVTSKSASFVLPNAVTGITCEFYAVANKSLGTITTKASLLALLEASPIDYNGTFAEVNGAAKRSDGFVMSGNISKAIAAEGAPTSIAITLKRTVAKIAVSAVQSSDFNSKYKGTVKINSVKLTKGATQTPIFKPTAVSSGALTFTHTQTSNVQAATYQNLFYVYENGVLTAGNRVALELSATYDLDGNFSTTADQTPVTYKTEIDGTSGAIVRNGYYRVAISITGLSGSDMSATISVADWETPVTQSVNLGQ